jgi:calpain-7
MLAADAYTLVVSTFSAGQVGDYELTVRSSLPLEVAPVPAEGAGMYSRKAKGEWYVMEDVERPRASPRSTHIG